MKRVVGILGVVLVVAALTAGCQEVKVGARCRGNAAASSGAWVVTCKNGHWTRLITKAAGLQLVAHLRQQQAQQQKPPPARPTPPVTVPPTTTTTVPQPVRPAAATAVSAGWFHSCALVTGGFVECWGQNLYSEVGNGYRVGMVGTDMDMALTPVLERGIVGATQLETSGEDSCVLIGTVVKCWGTGANGALGSVQADSADPVTIPGLPPVTKLGRGALCDIASGSVYCWGPNLWGNVGNGTVGQASPVAQVTGISTAVAVATSTDHACAVLTDGTVRCWGHNYSGQLGDGSAVDSSIPVVAVGVSHAVSVAVGTNNTCALISDGSVQCWGLNFFGALGNGSTTDSSTAVPVSGLTDATSLIVGQDYACALRSTGGVECWGRDDAGQVGDGTMTLPSVPHPTPESVVGLTNATSLSGGFGHACVTVAGGSLECWGEGDQGQLGTGEPFGSSAVPVSVANIP